MDSDSSVDGVELDGKLYRLKCDCCRAKRKETEYDFHPCKVGKCTFAICWPCLQKWKDQSDKDVTKRFECPQCHTEYDTQLIEQHKPLSTETIHRLNAAAKLKRKQRKKRRKKREQEIKTKKTDMTKHQKLLMRRLEENNKKKNKKKKKLNTNAINDSNTHILNKNKVMIDFKKNLILKQQWNEKMIHDIFGKIGPIATYDKTDSVLSVTYRKAQSDKARRVLLYLFDLNISMTADIINYNTSNNVHDMFNPNINGGIREFLKKRDAITNWNEYSIPNFGHLMPPGGKRVFKEAPKRLTKHRFLSEMSKRSKIKVMNGHRQPPPPSLPPMNRNQHNMSINVYPTHSNSSSSLLPQQRPLMSAASLSMSDMKPRAPPLSNARAPLLSNHRAPPLSASSSDNLGVINRNNGDYNGIRRNDKGNDSLRRNNDHIFVRTPSPATESRHISNSKAPPGIDVELQRRRPPPGMDKLIYNGYKEVKINNNNIIMNGDIQIKRRQNKIDNILAFKYKKKKEETMQLKEQIEGKKEVIPLKEIEEKKEAIPLKEEIRWICNGTYKLIHIISSDDDSDRDRDCDSQITATKSELTILSDDANKQQSVQSIQSINTVNGDDKHDDNDDEYYDYSSSDDDININDKSQLNAVKLQLNDDKSQLNDVKLQLNDNESQLNEFNDDESWNDSLKLPQSIETKKDCTEPIRIQDMTIQEMMDNLDSFDGSQVDALLAKLLSNEETKNDEKEETKADRNNTLDYENGNVNGEQDHHVFEPFDEPKHHSFYVKKNENDEDLRMIQSLYNDDKSAVIKDNNCIETSPESIKKGYREEMEYHRSEMEDIAAHYPAFNLSKLPELYYRRTNISIKNVYYGKMKDLISYFDDIFTQKYNDLNNQTIIISLISSNDANPKLKQVKTVKASKKSKMKWKKKDESVLINNNNNNNNEDFRYGPSAMYTVPRIAPNAHSHIIGQTAAVNTANAYANAYSMKGTNRYTARPYKSQRKRSKAYDRKVKTYGDYNDGLPTTPSGSEDDDF